MASRAGTLTVQRQMRVLYDISALGLAYLYQLSRGGSYRVDMHITEGLAASGECELLFCANHSTVAYHGCEAFLRGHQRLGGVPLIAPCKSRDQSSVRAAASAAHRCVRRLFGNNVLPSAVRHCAAFVDKRLHPSVADAASAVDILHSPSTPLPARPKQRSPQRVLTVYDLAYLRFPKIYGAAYQRSAMAAIRSLRPGDSLITTSRFVRDELCEQGVTSGDRIHVVPLAAHPSLFYRCADPHSVATVRCRYGIPEGPYVLSVNSPDPRKNVPHVIHAFARAAYERRDVMASLVLAGNAGPGSDRIRKTIAEYPALRGRIVLTGYVPDEDLAPLYTGAQVFVYPSIYEGFGLPPLEAMQCGTPVITSNTSSLPEVVGDGGVMVAPDDVNELAGAMLDLARDTDRRGHLQQRALARARRFSWEFSTAATLRAYRAALQG
jgi:glycosyltransferase involved in cell wall biosynthesis